jgi:hypothetical protein
MIQRWIVHFQENTPPMTTARPETRLYTTLNGANTRMSLPTEWRANLLSVSGETEEVILSVLEEVK